jgi:hypothetical protein
MDFLCHFSKVGLLAPALVIEIVIPSFFPCPPPTHTPQHAHSNFPMPPTATTKTKNWGQADKDLLADLTNRQLIDITDTSHQNIEQVRDLHFRHRDKRNFRRNFHDYSAAWDLEIEYSGARRNRGEGKMRHFILLIFLPARVL